MRKDESDVRVSGRSAVEQAEYRTARVGVVLDGRRIHAGLDVLAARRVYRMCINNRIPPVELIKHRLKRRIPEPMISITGHQPDAIRFQRVECIFDLAQAILNGWERQHGK